MTRPDRDRFVRGRAVEPAEEEARREHTDLAETDRLRAEALKALTSAGEPALNARLAGTRNQVASDPHLTVGEPPIVRLAAELVKVKGGLVLVAGPTGSGESTTLAAAIDRINETGKLHVITIEDPIGFVHANRGRPVRQREVGTHATSLTEALKGAQREDPDLIMVGEMRESETVSMAPTAAERDTFVFGALHTNDAVKTVDLIVSVFTGPEQQGVRNVFGECPPAVMAQQLMPKVGGEGVAAIEILFSSPAVGNTIREGMGGQIPSGIRTGVKHGMVDTGTSIRALFEEGKVTARAACDRAIDEQRLWNFGGGGGASPDEPDPGAGTSGAAVVDPPRRRR